METGFTTVSSKGQIVIPQKIRELLKIREGTPFLIETRNESIVIKKINLPKIKSWKESTADFKKAAAKAKFTKEDLEKAIVEVRIKKNESRS